MRKDSIFHPSSLNPHPLRLPLLLQRPHCFAERLHLLCQQFEVLQEMTEHLFIGQLLLLP